MFSRFKTFVSEKIDTIKAEIDATTEENKAASSPLPAKRQNETSSPAPLKKVDSGKSLESGSWNSTLDTIKRTIEPAESDIPVALWKTNVSSNAGQPFIRRYENMWNMCHENNIDLGRAAERTDRTLRTAISSANKHHKALRDLEKTLHALPSFLDTVTNAVKKAESLKNRLEQLEEAFEEVAKQRGTLSSKNFRKQLSDSVADYHKSKETELHQIEYKLRVEKQRADRDEEIQKNLKRLEEARKIQQEKEAKEEAYREQQQKLQDAFQKELAEFKEKGHIEKMGENDKTTLETFDLDVDTSELNSFLDEDTDGSNIPVGVDPSLVYDVSDEDESVEIIPVIEDPEAEYQRYLALEFQNITENNEEDQIPLPDSSAGSLLELNAPAVSSADTIE